MKVVIECPVCSSGNHFQIEQIESQLPCEDCGFPLLENPSTKRTGSTECYFCGNDRYYYESPLSLSILGRDSVCYICEAHYKNIDMGNPDLKFSDEAFQDAQQTPAAINWKQRIEQYLKT